MFIYKTRESYNRLLLFFQKSTNQYRTKTNHQETFSRACTNMTRELNKYYHLILIKMYLQAVLPALVSCTKKHRKQIQEHTTCDFFSLSFFMFSFCSKQVHSPSECCTCREDMLHSSSAISQYKWRGNDGCREERGALLHPHMNSDIYNIPHPQVKEDVH